MVVVSKTKVKKLNVSLSNSSDDEQTAVFECHHFDKSMAAKAILICRPNSHPFEDRTVLLDDGPLNPLKIGRSVAKAKPATNNGYFDCKVLSRNHAVLWYENGKFYLKDTKSSNGTFVNSDRLSETAKDSAPREISSGDVVQFGVDVVENSKKVTHGCIIATLKLYLPDGKEAKQGNNVALTLDELHRVASHLQEALQRERLLQTKLVNLQRVVEQTKQATDLGWKAAIEEDRLLSRVAFLENQLRTITAKNQDDNTLRDQLTALQEEKYVYQQSAKELLQQLHKDRLEVLERVTYLEQALRGAQTDCSVAQAQLDACEVEMKQLMQQLQQSQAIGDELAVKLQDMETENDSLHKKIDELREEENSVRIQLNALINFLNNPDIIHTLRDEMQQLRNTLLNNNHERDENLPKRDDNSMKSNDNSHQFGDNSIAITKDDQLINNDENTFKFSDELTSMIIEADKLMNKDEGMIKAEDNSIMREDKSVNKDEIITDQNDGTANLKETSYADIERLMKNTQIKLDILENVYPLICNQSLLLKSNQLNHNNDNNIAINDHIMIKDKLLTEQALKEQVINENVELKQQLLEAQQLQKESKNEAQQMQDRIKTLLDELEEARNNSEPSNAHVKEKEVLENKLNELENRVLTLKEEAARLKIEKDEISLLQTRQIGTEIDTESFTTDESLIPMRNTDLEDELILIKEIHSKCPVELKKCKKEMQLAIESCKVISNRTNAYLFCVVAPLVIIIAYLLITRH